MGLTPKWCRGEPLIRLHNTPISTDFHQSHFNMLTYYFRIICRFCSTSRNAAIRLTQGRVETTTTQDNRYQGTRRAHVRVRPRPAARGLYLERYRAPSKADDIAKVARDIIVLMWMRPHQWKAPPPHSHPLDPGHQTPKYKYAMAQPSTIPFAPARHPRWRSRWVCVCQCSVTVLSCVVPLWLPASAHPVLRKYLCAFLHSLLHSFNLSF